MRKRTDVGLALLLGLAAVAEAREEIIFFERHGGEVWAIQADGRNERMLYKRSADLAAWVTEERKVSWQVAPQGMQLTVTSRKAADGVGLEWALVRDWNGATEVVTPFEHDATIGHLAEDGERIVYMGGEGSYSTGYPIYVVDLRDPSRTPRLLTTANRGVAFAWWEGGARAKSGLTIERLPAEMSVRGAYGSSYSDAVEPDGPTRGFQVVTGRQVTGLDRIPVDRMTAHDVEALDRGLGKASQFLATTPFKYSVVPNAFNGEACPVSADNRSRALSTLLGPDWTVTSYGGDIVGPAAHHYSVATFWAEDGTAYHFEMDNYVFVPTMVYLGSSGEGFPAWWSVTERERTPEQAFYREGQPLTHLDGVPVDAVRYDRDALEKARQANARLMGGVRRDVTAEPRATRFGRTLLPFRLTARDLQTQQPLAGVLVRVRLTGASDGLSFEEERAGETYATSLGVLTDAAGTTPVVYLRVEDPYRHDLTNVAVNVSVNGGEADVVTWDVFDNLKELEARFRASFPAGRGSSAHQDLLEGEETFERVAFMGDVVLEGLGDDGAAHRVDRVLAFLGEVLRDDASAHLLNGLVYHPVWARNRGAVHFATVVYPEAAGWDSPHARVFDAGATRSPVSYERDAWLGHFGGPDAQVALDDLGAAPADAPTRLTALVSCPVEVLFTDARGRRAGFADGAHVNELAAPLSHTRQDLPEADGTHAKLVTYGDDEGTLTIVGQADGTFTLDLLYHQADGTALWVEFTEVPIVAGETVTFPLDRFNPATPGERAGGGLVQPRGPATRLNPPRPAAGRRAGGGCSMTGPQTGGAPGAAALVGLALLVVLARSRRQAVA